MTLRHQAVTVCTALLACFFLGALPLLAHDNPGSAQAVIEHQEKAAKAAQRLSSQASMDLTIGIEAGDIAKEQVKSSVRAAEVAVDIEANPQKGIRAFIFGSDYKNLGSLRSEIVTTENRISRLERMRDNTTDPIARATIDAQITEMKSANEATLAFIEEHQSGFSLFGWLLRILGR